MYFAQPQPEMAPAVKEDTRLDTDIVAQTRGLDRGTIMKELVGPRLQAELEPTYSTEFSDTERQMLSDHLPYIKPHETNFDRLRIFSRNVVELLNKRLQNELDTSSTQNVVQEFIEARRDIFFYDGAVHVYSESVATGVHTSLMLGSYVYRLEDDEYNMGITGDDIISIPQFVESMQRPSFNKMLLHLTRGPNGFLGVDASAGNFTSPNFFSFDTESDKNLRYADAFELASGKVLGLSSAYFLAAHRKRQSISKSETYYGKNHGKDSSGCPVRHSFMDEIGTSHEPLVITAKNFVATAMQVATEEASAK